MSTKFFVLWCRQDTFLFFLLTVEIVVHTIVVDVEAAMTLVVVCAVPVVAPHRVIKTDALHSVEDICSVIVLVEAHVIVAVMNRVIINVAVLVLEIVVELVEVAKEHVLAVVLVTPSTR